MFQKVEVSAAFITKLRLSFGFELNGEIFELPDVERGLVFWEYKDNAWRNAYQVDFGMWKHKQPVTITHLMVWYEGDLYGTVALSEKKTVCNGEDMYFPARTLVMTR